MIFCTALYCIHLNIYVDFFRPIITVSDSVSVVSECDLLFLLHHDNKYNDNDKDKDNMKNNDDNNDAVYVVFLFDRSASMFTLFTLFSLFPILTSFSLFSSFTSGCLCS